MKRKTKEATSLSSSSAFIIIIILVVVSVAAIVVGGGDGFARKYAGVDFREVGARSVLAQTGVVGKVLEFELMEGTQDYTLKLNEIELDGTVLGASERYASSVVPPLEGDSPFWYRTSAGSSRDTQGYPLDPDYVADELSGYDLELLNQNQTDIPGMVDCSSNPGSEYGFQVFFEDLAYNTNTGFDDSTYGQARQDEVCQTLQEFEDMLMLSEGSLKPSVVVQSSEEGTPEYSLSVVSPQYVGGSGFVSTLLADYLRSGVKRSQNSFSENVSILGVNSGFMRFNFDDVDWSVDTGSTSDYDLATVVRQNTLRLLGFGSFLGHEQENILNNTWKRWTEWDRLVFDENLSPFVNSVDLVFSSEDSEFPGSSDVFDDKLFSDSVKVLGLTNIPDTSVIPAAQNIEGPSVYTSSNWQKGQNFSGINDPQAVSYPVLGAGQFKTVTQEEKEILCMLGLAVDGVAGCDAPRSVVDNTYLERENNRAVCVNVFNGVKNAFTEDFTLSSFSHGNPTSDILNDPNRFTFYTQECSEPDFDTPADKAAFDALYATTNMSEAVAFGLVPATELEDFREYYLFEYDVKDTTAQRKTDKAQVAIHKCVITANTNQLCNGDFQFSNGKSPIDFQLSSLEDRVNNDGQDVIGCASTTAPGWCGQGTPDVYSSLYGYTWHPYLINNPEADDADIVDSPRKYAGGNSEVIVQRLRIPLTPNLPYEVSGKVYVTEDGLTPRIWYGSQGAILKQSDKTYHINYPEFLVEGNNPDVLGGPLTNTPLVAGMWHEFSYTLNPGLEQITHIGFGATNETGYVFFDDLSVKYVSGCGDCFSDYNGDCVTGAADLLTFLSSFGGDCPGETLGCLGDVNIDGVIDTADLLAFLSLFGSECEVVEDVDSGDEVGFDIGGNIIVVSTEDAQIGRNSFDIRVELIDSEQIVPNSQGFRSNYKVRIVNQTDRDLKRINMIGVIPNLLTYEDHVATQSNIAFKRSGSVIYIPKLESGEEIEIYFNVELDDGTCFQTRRGDLDGYQKLIDIGLCDSFERTRNKIQDSKSSGGNSTPPVDSGLEGNPGTGFQCDDGIDNDGDGFIDYPNDPNCSSTSDDSEAPGLTQCDDGIDNDGDGRIDYPADPQCSSASDDKEAF